MWVRFIAGHCIDVKRVSFPTTRMLLRLWGRGFRKKLLSLLEMKIVF